MAASSLHKLLSAREHALGSDATRQAERSEASDRMTARERMEALFDAGSASELGMLAGRTTEGDWLPTEGGVDFVGAVNGQPVVASASDFTQHGGGYGAGQVGRLCELAYEQRWPVVIFAEGGGSKAVIPGAGSDGLHRIGGNNGGPNGAFEGLAEVSGWVPTVAVVPGPSFAGHATMAASCDVIIGVRGASLGMGGPPMVEAAFGVRLKPHELAPVEMHETNGGLELLVDTEAKAIEAVCHYLSFWNDQPSGAASDSARDLRTIVPDEGPYDMHEIIDALVDEASFFEMRARWTPSVITGLSRLSGRTVGVLANQPLAANEGAIDSDGADKIARFVQLCDSFGYPIVSLVDTPGFIHRTAPDAEWTEGISRHHARPIRAQHHRSSPLMLVQIRKARGLAVAAMAGVGNGGSTPIVRLAWPTVELGVDDRYTSGFDDVIDPADTRDRLISVLRLTKRLLPSTHRGRPRDAW